MVTGAVTSAYVGTYSILSGALTSALNALNMGGYSGAYITKDIHLIPAGVSGDLVHVVTIERAA